MQKVTVIGGGLAGCEATWQLVSKGVPVDLYEMRPVRKTEAHATDGLAELVCSNSLGSTSEGSASGILKSEVRALGSFILQMAEKHAVPAGTALALDRTEFSREITETFSHHPLIRLHREELQELPSEGIVIVATGPLTSPALAQVLMAKVGNQSLYFYDALAPIVAAESLNLEKMFVASRYGKGTADYLNIPLTREQYDRFIDDILAAEVVLPKDFEKECYFEGCLPIEVLAARGRQTLAFGPMKPVGFIDPHTGRRPFAVVQLRAENRYRTAYNLVGFQTKMKYGEQTRILRTLPGLEGAEFLRLGSMHRNTYLNSPEILLPTLQLKSDPRVFIAGQLTGTEGYLESAATGLIAGQNAFALVQGGLPRALPEDTVLGGLLSAITLPREDRFQPINANFGVLPPLPTRMKSKAERNAQYAERSRVVLNGFLGLQAQ